MSLETVNDRTVDSTGPHRSSAESTHASECSLRNANRTEVRVEIEAAAAPTEEAVPSRVLLVDDEPNVLKALRRSLRGRGYEFLTAGSGEEALDLLRRNVVDAIVSDMRMPGMNGAEFLKASLAITPDAVRVLLTGNVDAESVVQAVNEGEIFRYIFKPWDDAYLRQVLGDGLARKALERERTVLHALIEQQSGQLRLLNAGLEEQVEQRTRELEVSLAAQRRLAEQLTSDFSSTVRLLSSLIETRAGLTARCPRRVARHVHHLGLALGVTGDALQDLTFAALLQDLGKLALPDELVRQPVEGLRPEARERVLRHPLLGEASLMALPSLHRAGLILHHVNENFDGSGTPGDCRGDAIPLAARILRVAADFEHYQAGAIEMTTLTGEQAFRRLRNFCGSRYDPHVVESFLKFKNQPLLDRIHTVLTSSDGLRAGMRLADDLVSTSGSLLLAQGHTLSDMMISSIRRLEQLSGEFLWIAVAAGNERQDRRVERETTALDQSRCPALEAPT